MGDAGDGTGAARESAQDLSAPVRMLARLTPSLPPINAPCVAQRVRGGGPGGPGLASNEIRTN